MKQLFIVALLFAPLVANAKMYMWYGDDGVPVYSQTPPPDGRATRDIKAPPPPAEAPAAAQQRLEEQLQKLEDAREDRELEKQEKAKAQTESETRRENCKAARKNLESLEARSRQLVRQPDGSFKRYTEEEKQALMDEQRKMIEKSCD